MPKSKENDSEHSSGDKTHEFVKKNWPIALLVTGGVVAGAVWLTARYLRQQKNREIDLEKHLKQVEDEVETSGGDPTVALLEHGAHLASVAGREVSEAANEIKQHITNPEQKEIFEALGNIAEIELQERKKKSGNG